ncbi:hypothetical protein RD792_009957 [Penstemon davidsonii]|uniref:Leucine-rich repeat-containing N-terminal plant-type domain-containing protein n=1 Tax=Penstemon davidsonii TaxID=160366 RepID=A0ABR0D0I1_9LAMI|nr:hypothetical protein RD792_009957 [Penstemon davidsonii]
MKASQFFILFLSLLSFLSAEKCHPYDKKALLKIKNDINNPYDIITWDPKTDCCEDWPAVQCDPKTNRITQLNIHNADIKRPIPASIAELPYLEGLSFRTCNLTGHITQGIAKLSNLKSIDLRQNHLTGPVPSFLGQLNNLEYIGFRKRWLMLILTTLMPQETGDISFVFGMKSLNYIDLSRNMLQFDFSKVVEFTTTLAHLDLNHNSIYGSIPQALAKTIKSTSSFSGSTRVYKAPSSILRQFFIHLKDDEIKDGLEHIAPENHLIDREMQGRVNSIQFQLSSNSMRIRRREAISGAFTAWSASRFQPRGGLTQKKEQESRIQASASPRHREVISRGRELVAESCSNSLPQPRGLEL